MPNTKSLWDVYWAPEGRIIATVWALDAYDAKRQAPKPYNKYLGEVYAERHPRKETP